MKISRIGGIAAFAIAGAVVLSSCAANEEPNTDASGGASESAEAIEATLSASGASSQQAAQTAWQAGFLEVAPGVTVNYEPTGSGTGRERFIAGASEFIGSDRAFNDEEIAAGEFAMCVTSDIVELPLYISPIAVVFNLEGVDSLNMSPATIAGIFAGEITNWNDPAIAEANPDAELPDLAISPVHRSDESGTTENFTEYLNAAAGDVWTSEADGVWPFAEGEAAQQTSGMQQAVSGGNGTIGYIDGSQVGDLGTVAVEVAGEYVEYSPEAAAAIVDASPFVEGRGEGDLAVEINRTPDEAAYPIALISYLIACQEYEDANVGAAVSAYLSYIASEDGQAASAESAGSAPISDDLRAQVEEAIALIATS